MSQNPSGNGTILRGAIIGFGNAAVNAHLGGWRKSDRFRIDAVVETQPERAALARELLPAARVHASIEDLLALESLDFVDICTPPRYHDELVLKACRAGLHVFCEKPIAISPDGLAQIHDAARKSERVVFTVNNWKYAPIWVKTAELIREGRIGAVRSVSMDVFRRPGSGGGLSDWRRCPEQAGGGILIDHGWHNLYLILSLIGEDPLSISARMQCAPGNESFLEEVVDLELGFRKAEVRLHLTWRADRRGNSGIIVGEKGTLHMNDDHLILDCGDAPSLCFNFDETLSAGSHHPEWMDPVVDHFGREIEDPEHRGSNLAEAMRCAKLIRLAYRSYREACCPMPVGDLP
ncbi:MAG: Gfo/Idh/MocA family oxidoreductase [Syntrophobacteraceae bacterium]